MVKKSFLLIILMLLTSAFLHSQTYQIKKYVVGSSAETASNSNYTFKNTVGQPAIGEYSSTDNTGKLGFWYDNVVPGEEETIQIEFQQGWNLVSSYIYSEYMDMETYINNISLATVIVKDGNADIYIPSAGLNTIGDWEIPDGYNVYVSEACTLSVTGTPATPENETIALDMGWNMIGYTRNSDMNPSDAYSSISSDVVIVKNGLGKIYIPKYNLNTIGDLTPGDGYLLFYNNSGNFTYPANSMGKSYNDNYFDNITKYYKSDFENTGKSAVYLLHTDLPDYAEIAIYNDDAILGTGVVRNNIAAVTVWGDNEMTENTTDGATENEFLNCKYYYRGTEKEIELSHIISYTDDNNEFNYSTNSFKTADAYLNNADKPVVYVSPNPVRDIAIINYHIEFDSNVEIKLVNSLGKTIKVLANKYHSPATYTLNLRTDGIAQGTYFIVMTTDDNVITKPVVILK